MPTTYAIPNGRTAFTATTWTGANTAAAITISNVDTGTVGFLPDLVWGKPRSLAYSHGLADTNRGVAAGRLSTNSTSAETAPGSFAYGSVSSFNSNGFSTSPGSTDNENWNTTNGTFVAWQWNAGSNTSVTNTTGTITSTVSANATAGFSIVTYTGTGSAATVGHGLGVAPSMVIVKSRSNAYNWAVYHSSLTSAAYALQLNTTIAQTNAYNYWNSTAPTSSVFSLGTDAGSNGNGNSLVAYCWAPIPGFSAFGSYTGNASTDGPFVYTGFRPRFIMVKNTANGAADWTILDSARNPYNLVNLELNPDLSNAESTANTADFLSNGFKLRSTYGNTNGSGQLLIYAAFAENPFKYANAR